MRCADCTCDLRGEELGARRSQRRHLDRSRSRFIRVVARLGGRALFTFVIARVLRRFPAYTSRHMARLVSWQGHSRRCDNLENDGLPLHITRTERYT